MPPERAESVFINCPFDAEYRALFHAIVFAIYDCGFFPRCSLDESDGGDVRLHKIIRILKSCQYSIHDISRTELDKTTGLPRFNMPLELGIDMGLRYSDNPEWAGKKCIVLDKDRHRFQKFISDISGQDPVAHGDDVNTSIKVIRDWLRTVSGRTTVATASAIINRYEVFSKELPVLSDEDIDKICFADYAMYASVWLQKRKASPS